MIDWIKFPKRSLKPRTTGLTMVLDHGLTVQRLSDILDNYAECIDMVKFGWGTALVTSRIAEKVALCRKHGIHAFLGGTFFELAHLYRKLDEFEAYHDELGLDYMEISDGTLAVTRSDKLAAIERFCKRFTVLTEVGGKDNEYIEAPKVWVESIRNQLAAGASIAIAEGREGGDAGLYRQNNELRTGLVDEIADEIPPERMLWEAPLKGQQGWFIKRFGADVNLGNIHPDHMVSLETLRYGLRKETLIFFHGGVPTGGPRS